MLHSCICLINVSVCFNLSTVLNFLPWHTCSCRVPQGMGIDACVTCSSLNFPRLAQLDEKTAEIAMLWWHIRGEHLYIHNNILCTHLQNYRICMYTNMAVKMLVTTKFGKIIIWNNYSISNITGDVWMKLTES